MKKEIVKKLAIVTIFAIAMAFLESAVVIYLRTIFYDGSFNFPLRGFTDSYILNIEWIRELFTIVMLLAVAFFAGKKLYERFAYFIYAFAVWDIFYYIWLKAVIGWPSSLMAWDLLFLIPWAWIGPVLAPLIVSATLISLSFVILGRIGKGKSEKMDILEWILFAGGMLLILYTFIIDYGKLLFSNPELIASYVPTRYNWAAFLIGEIMIIYAIVNFYLRKK